MKYIPLKEIDILNGSINFTTMDSHVLGICEIYTTKQAGDDKKMYRQIEATLEHRHQTNVRAAESLSPPAPAIDGHEADQEDNDDDDAGGRDQARSRTAESIAISLERETAFGTFKYASNRRNFEAFISVLNAVHPDHDFSQVPCPDDFHRERSLRSFQNHIDTTLYSLRPKLGAEFYASPTSHSSLVTASNDFWNPRMWDRLDVVMDLQKCELYKWKPTDDPFSDGGFIWSMHYLILNKKRKRICYFHLRALSVFTNSPVYRRPGYWRLKESRHAKAVMAGKRTSYWLDEAEQGFDTYDYANDNDYELHYPESSDDEGVDRLSYSNFEYVHEEIAAGRWGNGSYDGGLRGNGRWPGADPGDSDPVFEAPASVEDYLGDCMEL